MAFHSERTRQLIEAAAAQLANGRFLDDTYLVDQDVASDETMVLDQTLPWILRGYLRLPDAEQRRISLLGWMWGDSILGDALGAEAIAIGNNAVEMDRKSAALATLNRQAARGREADS